MTRIEKIVLYVEDDRDHAELVQRSWDRQAFGGQILHVEDGEAAIDYLARIGSREAARPWLILLDLRLPRVDGFEVLRTVKTTPALSDIPVVVLTTSSSDGDLEKAYQGKANSYLIKPDAFPELDELVKTLGDYWLSWNAQPAGEH